MPRFDAVLFDLFGTLAQFDPPREEIQKISAAAHGLSVNTAGILSGYVEADAFMERQNATKPLRSMNEEQLAEFFAEYEQMVLAGAGLAVDLEVSLKVWQTVRQQRYGLALFSDVPEALILMREQGRVVGVVSNMGESGNAVAGRIGLTPYIDFIVTSNDAGANKPHPPIFLAALERAGVSADAAILVGDSVDTDIIGAAGVGIAGVLLDRESRYGRSSTYDRSPRIEGLGELLALINRLENPC
jgi:putative hydrolase of the HAD superfamily